ncbi:MAG: DUF3857 domain-containing protein [Bacteroidia bacterium]
MLRKSLCIVAWCASSALFAQKEDLTESFAKRYVGENSVFVAKTESHTIKIESNKPVIYSENHEDIMILSDKMSTYSDRNIYFSSFTEITRIDGYTLYPDGKGGYKTNRAEKLGITNEFASGSFYDDYRAQHVGFGNIQRGSRMVLNYTEKLNEARFFGRFFFNASIPTEYSEFSVLVPKGVKIITKLFGITEKDLTINQTKVGNAIRYTWRAQNPAKYKSEVDGPSISYFAPHIVVYIAEYTNQSGDVVKLLNGTDGLYDWYYSMVAGVGKKENTSLQNLVDSLVAGETDEFKKVTKIFYWVQDNIKYVAFEDGMGGFVPREAADVCERRYGDCKDMGNIIVTMLRLANIPAYITWIGTRSIPYTYDQVPTPISDNHMIATYIQDSTYWFLDAPGKNAPIGMHTSMIQGKEALLAWNNNTYKVIRVPVIPKEQNTRVDSVVMYADLSTENLSSVSLYGNGYSSIRGYEKIHLTYPLDAMNEQDKLKFFVGYFEKGNNTFGVDSLHFLNLYDRSKNLEVDYKFRINDYVRRNGNELYVNFNIDKSFQNRLLDSEKRQAPLEIDYLNTERHVTIMEIPEGWTVGYLPPNASYNGTDFGFTISYKQIGNRIYCERNIYINTLLVKPEQFETWNKFIKLLGKAYTETVIIKKKA